MNWSRRKLTFTGLFLPGTNVNIPNSKPKQILLRHLKQLTRRTSVPYEPWKELDIALSHTIFTIGSLTNLHRQYQTGPYFVLGTHTTLQNLQTRRSSPPIIVCPLTGRDWPDSVSYKYSWYFYIYYCWSQSVYLLFNFGKNCFAVAVK
jgi:hypothetical protein